MKRRIRRTRQVRDDIITIYRYLYDRSKQAADKVFVALRRSIEGLLDTPGIGRLWDSPDPRLQGMRMTTVRPYRNYLILFRATPGGVEVFRVVHAARALQPLVDEIVIEFEDEDEV
jgi:plasmid stabilization system protein ParE